MRLQTALPWLVPVAMCFMTAYKALSKTFIPVNLQQYNCNTTPNNTNTTFKHDSAFPVIKIMHLQDRFIGRTMAAKVFTDFVPTVNMVAR